MFLYFSFFFNWLMQNYKLVSTLEHNQLFVISVYTYRCLSFAKFAKLAQSCSKSTYVKWEHKFFILLFVFSSFVV